jgi:hypothetical protein
MTRHKYKTQRSTKQVSLKRNNYCAKIYARTKSPKRHNVRTKAWLQRYVVIQVMCATDFCQGLSDKPCELVPDTDSFMIRYQEWLRGDSRSIHFRLVVIIDYTYSRRSGLP